MQNLWRQVSEKYPNWRFGYTEKDGVIQLSVADTNFRKVKFTKLLPDQPLQVYATAYVDMLKELLPAKAGH